MRWGHGQTEGRDADVTLLLASWIATRVVQLEFAVHLLCSARGCASLGHALPDAGALIAVPKGMPQRVSPAPS